MDPRDAWRDVEVLLVDGNNLLHAVAGDAGPGPLRGLLARIAAAVPRSIATTVVLDGPPDPGAPSRMRVRPGLLVRHAGRIGADALLVHLVEEHPYLERAGVVVVTNDVALGDHVRKAGGRIRPVAWLQARLEAWPSAPSAPGSSIAGPRPRRAGPAGGASGTTSDHARPPAGSGTPRRTGSPGGSPATGEQDDEREPWRPGRGATRKRGNPRRAPRGER